MFVSEISEPPRRLEDSFYVGRYNSRLTSNQQEQKRQKHDKQHDLYKYVKQISILQYTTMKLYEYYCAPPQWRCTNLHHNSD